LKFAFPSAAIIPLLSGNISGYYWMLPRESENQYDVRRVNIGSGPFWVSDYRPSVSLTLRRNDGWYDAAKIYIDNLTQPIVPEYATGLAQFRSGGIYGSTGVGGFVVKPDDILQTKNDVPALNLFLNDPASQGNIIFFGWNPSFGNGTAFRDKRMRQGLSMAIDRDLWIDTFYNVTKFKNAGIPMTTVWNSALTTNWPGWWLDPRGEDLGPDAKNYQYNPSEAKKLIAAAGFPNGTELKAQYPLTGYSAEYVKMSETLQGFAKEVGLTLTTSPV